MRRPIARPYGQSISFSRALSLLMMLAVLWVLYDWARRPATWQWLATARENRPGTIPAVAGDSARPGPPEVIVPGPGDRDPVEFQEFRARRELISDRAPLRPREMPLYWRLMGWSRTEGFDKLEKRALKDVAFTQLWEQPDRYRGQLVRLRMHVRRVLHYAAPENPSGLKDVYEAWGWTDESKSFPYVVVFPERPPGLPIGSDVRSEVVFVGYFLKVMSYSAFDVARGAPLLVGRARLVPNRSMLRPAPSSNSAGIVLLVVVLICVAVFGVQYFLRFRRRGSGGRLPDELNISGDFNRHISTSAPIVTDVPSPVCFEGVERHAPSDC